MVLERGPDGSGVPPSARAVRALRVGSAVLVLGVVVPVCLAAGPWAGAAWRPAAALVLAVAQAVVLGWAVRGPGAVLGASALLGAAMWLLLPALSLTGALLGAQLALCVLSALRPVRVSRYGLLGMLALGPLAYVGAGTLSLVTHVLAVTLAWTAGQWRRAQQQRLAAETRRAVAEERARIAREVHDVVAHTVSVMVIQASAAEDVFDADPEQARHALRAIDDAGRSALGELRVLLRAEGGREGDDGRRPPRGFDDLAELAANARAAGLAVELDIQGNAPAPPAAVALAAYRIVQEALTNTLRHAGASRVRVSVCRDEEAVRIEVSDNGRFGGRSWRGGGSGRGLAGMRERAALLGGTLDAGPGPDGGFRVRAVLPIRCAS
ncbi:histidine kinase [Streptomyces sp. ASQP_92]|uniref:sensor histidine kinase n=1 Tax=Streptomyces sp. ASQP_92 TaxID=2979116 RepID=UPI0021BF078C|nr:histidine kinase [Streptomyces sp. ASQP_92]MCT9093369.1 histidine kinase [Streptomyces sp. ASQP_92]